MKCLKYITVLIMLPFMSSFLFAQAGADKQKDLSIEEELLQVQTALKEMQKDYQQKIEVLQTRIEMLEKEKQEAGEISDLERLLKEAEKLAAQEAVGGKDPGIKVFTSGQRQQQSLNPNISLTGDFIGNFSMDTGEFGRQFMLREAEFHIISNLDPYTRAKFFLGVPRTGSLHIGEAYMEWLNLPLHLGLKIGKYRTQFGILNRWHDHGLFQIDRPRVLTQFLSEEGLGGFGAGANMVLPKLWAHVNELDLEVIYGGDGVSFTDQGDQQWVAIGHFKNYYDLTSNAYLELGVSGAYGHHDLEGDSLTFLGGVDLTYKWVPSGRSKYRTFEFRNELFISHRQDSLNDVTSYGFYSYIENKLNARWWIGIRFDYAQLPDNSDEYLWGFSPHVTFWQSEFVFIRLQFNHEMTYRGDVENVLMLQTVWSLGPHKHEAY